MRNLAVAAETSARGFDFPATGRVSAAIFAHAAVEAQGQPPAWRVENIPTNTCALLTQWHLRVNRRRVGNLVFGYHRRLKTAMALGTLGSIPQGSADQTKHPELGE